MSNATSYFSDGGKSAASARQRFAHGRFQLQRVRVGLLKDADPDGGAAVEAQVQRIVLGAQLRPADVAQQDQPAVGGAS